MEAIFKKFTDPYERKARLYPALLAALPVIVFVSIYTEWFTFDIKNALYITIVAAGLFWLSGKTRNLGKAVENRLVAKWGGMPSVTLLRHRDSVLDRYTTERYHKAAAGLADIPLPDHAEEEIDPTDADERYRAVTSALLSKTRDVNEYPLLFKENINYGFWRNLRGVKPIGCAFSVTIVVLGLWFDRALVSNLQLPDGAEFAVAASGIFITISSGA